MSREGARWDAWTSRQGTSRDEARRRYVTLVDELAEALGRSG